MGRERIARARVFGGVAGCLGLLVCSNADALQFDLGPQTSLSMTTTLSYTLGYRVQDQKNEILNNPNADDGDRAFDGLFQNELDGITELSLRYRDKYGLFVRGEAYYDEAYDHSDNNSFATSNTPTVPANAYTHYTRHTHGQDARLLDAFVYGTFDLGPTYLNLRAGRQVVQWGESLFLQGIATAQGPVDATKSHKPSTEVKEVLLPVGQVLAQWDLTPNLSSAAYYQWQWSATRRDGSGSYFSTSDLIGGNRDPHVLLASVPGVGVVPVATRGRDSRPHGPQYGFNLHYTVPALNYTDFGAYYVRYNDHNPSVITDLSSQNYYVKYFDDIDLYGLSYSTTFGRVQTGGEATLRKGRPVRDDNGQTVRADEVQVQTSAIINLPFHLLGEQITTFTGEMGVNTITDRSSSRLQNDKTAAGYQAQLSLSYTNVMPSLDLTVPFTIKQGVYNNSSIPGSFNSGNLQLQIGANFVYQNDWEFGLSYVNYRGDVSDDPLTDRDFVSANIKYSF